MLKWACKRDKFNSAQMDSTSYLNDLSNKDNFNYLIASGITPFAASKSADGNKSSLQIGKWSKNPQDLQQLLKRSNQDYFRPSPT